ncbi:ATP-dependent Clp protease adaptor ClpS [archaeon]|jgi:ATP-dependent Clp protease adaptor protein ClpS|nr:ATP-dependent Clp protease adaptor ClpS [archaeon]
MKSTKKKLILYNDNVNSFDNVIDSLMKICGYNIYQAEQCALIVHNTGKCVLKEGRVQELEEFMLKLQSRRLKIKIV